jgi:iron complex outermembrane receptor protein
MTTKHHPQGRIPVRRARLAAAMGIVLGVALPTHAQTQQASAAEANEPPAASAETQPATSPAKQGGEQLDTIIVTGSNIRRAEIEGPSPVTVITAEQMEREGHATVFDALETSVIATGSVETELSGGFSANASPLNLRGLGPGRSLLLIDGRRAADYPFPYEGTSNFQNFGNIPSAAVERIEILSGGASAIYGADAVSGVVNVILKKNVDGQELKLRGGTSTLGGRDRFDAQWVGGASWDRASLVYALQFYEQELLYGFQRDDWDLRRNPNPDPRLGVQPDAGLRIRRGGTGSSNPLIAPPAGTCERWGGEFFNHTYRRVNSSGNVVPLGNGCGTWNDAQYVHLSRGRQDVSGYLYGTWNFSDDLEAWASLQVWRSKTESLGGFESITGPHTDGVGRRNDFFDPQFNAVIAPSRRLTPVDLGGVRNMNQHYREFTTDFAFGLRGSIGEGWDWRATVSRADYDFERERRRMVGNLVNDFFFGPQLGTRPNGVPIYRMNLDRFYRPMTPAEYASISTIARYEATSWVTAANAVITGELMELPGGPLAMAAVLDIGQQGYELDSDPRIQPGVTQLYNLTGTNGGGERNKYALGVEFSIPVLEQLRFSLAGRFDKYDDITAVDDAKTWNFGVEWRPLENLLLRGAYATSFKAPDMHWVFSEGAGSFGGATDVWRCIQANANPSCAGYDYSVFSVTRGDPNIEEETGNSWSAGVVWDITRDLSITADYWSIELNGAIDRLPVSAILRDEAGCRTGRTLSGAPFAYAAGSVYCNTILSLVTRTPEDGQAIDRIQEVRSLPINQAYQKVTGIDAGLGWRVETDRLGTYRFNLAWSHTLRSERQQFATDPVQRDWRDNPFNLDFRSRTRMGVDWRLGDWDASVSGVRYGTLPTWDETGRTRPMLVWNANIGKRITPALDLKFFVNNVFNALHPEDDSNVAFPYFYDTYSPVGREVALQARYRFR